jgi:hypothetical protein
MIASHLRWDFGLMFGWLCNQGCHWNHKRVSRMYCELALNLRIKPKRRLSARDPKSLGSAAHRRIPVGRWISWPIGLLGGLLFAP